MPQKTLNLTELRNWCCELVQSFSSRQVVLLTGDLGAGKTQWVRLVVEALGGESSASPTFSVINEYKTSRGQVHHVDLYRLEDQEELDSVGFWDLFSQSKGLILIEWAGHLNPEDIPVDWKRMDVHVVGDGDQRVFTYEVH